MKQNYLFCLAIACFFTVNAIAQSVPIYATTQSATVGAEITSTANGPATFMGDKIVLAGTERHLDSIVVRVFNLTSNAPFTLSTALYTDCMSSTLGCGSGPGTMLPGSERTISITPTATVGTIFTVTVPYNGLDIASETDNEIAVMMNASRNDVYWVLNESITTGAAPAGETPESVVIRCGSTVTLNNGCTRAFTNAVNNFSMIVSASASLGITSNAVAKLQVYPNPVTGILTISAGTSMRKVSLIDLSGRIVKDAVIGGVSNYAFDVSDIAKGNYLLRVDGEKESTVKKIIKN